MHDDKLIELADSYIEAFMAASGRDDIQHMLRLVALRAALLEVQNIHGRKNHDD